MKYTLQVFSGSRDAAAVTAEDVIRRIDAAASRMQVDQVIIGWNTDASLYEKVGAVLSPPQACGTGPVQAHRCCRLSRNAAPDPSLIPQRESMDQERLFFCPE